ncbi:pprA [Symbiodinium microadriaticum]|nr:pprA [Symbiodinium microadriaticum]
MKRYLAVAMAMAGLTACAGMEDDGPSLSGNTNLAQLAESPRSGSNFSRALADEYQVLATNEYRVMGDYVDADYFAKKGLRAASGTEVAPEDPRDWDIAEDRQQELLTARRYLTDIFKAGGKTRAAEATARAQTKFDCWVEEEEEGVQVTRIDACKQAYAEIVAALTAGLKPRAKAEPAPPKPVRTAKPKAMPKPEPIKPAALPARRAVVILFDSGSTRLSSEAIIALENLATSISGSVRARALVVGHADKTGNARMNEILSQQRAATVVNALVNAGAPADRVAMTWRGESDPAVPITGGSVQNRRVVVVVDTTGGWYFANLVTKAACRLMAHPLLTNSVDRLIEAGETLAHDDNETQYRARFLSIARALCGQGCDGALFNLVTDLSGESKLAPAPPQIITGDAGFDRKEWQEIAAQCLPLIGRRGLSETVAMANLKLSVTGQAPPPKTRTGTSSDPTSRIDNLIGEEAPPPPRGMIFTLKLGLSGATPVGFLLLHSEAGPTGEQREALEQLAKIASQTLTDTRRRTKPDTDRRVERDPDQTSTQTDHPSTQRIKDQAGFAVDALWEADARGRIVLFQAISKDGRDWLEEIRAAKTPNRKIDKTKRALPLGLTIDRFHVLASEESPDENLANVGGESLADLLTSGVAVRQAHIRLPTELGRTQVLISAGVLGKASQPPQSDNQTDNMIGRTGTGNVGGTLTIMDGRAPARAERRALLELVDRLDNARAREQDLRIEAETLLQGLRLLTDQRPSQDMFEALINLLKKRIGFDDAIILRPHWQGGLMAASSTMAKPTEPKDWAGYDTGKPGLFEESDQRLQALSDISGEQYQSGFSVGLEIEGRDAWLIGLGRDAGVMTTHHLGLADRLALLTSQALASEAQKNKAIQSSKLATLGEMATGIAHEINQPLASISLAAQNLELILEDEELDLEFALSKVDRIMKQVERAAKIVNHMRVFARQSYDHDQTFHPGNQIMAALSIVGEQMRNHSITVDLDLDEQGPSVIGDPIQFEQVILNLLSNARDAIDSHREKEKAAEENASPLMDEGQIRVTCETVDNDWVRVAIRDNGGGFPDDVRDQLFDPFFTTKEVGSGTGLGLSISYGIIQDMGGVIDARNEGDGAMIEVMLRRASHLTAEAAPDGSQNEDSV